MQILHRFLTGVGSVLTEAGEVFAKVHGGTEVPSAEFGDYPWTCAVGSRINGFFAPDCGGALVAPGWVLTANHGCLRKKPIVVVGRFDLKDSHLGEERRALTPVPEPEFADLVLVPLEKPVSAQPVELIDPQETNAQPGDQGLLLGWGRRSLTLFKPAVLHKAELPIVEHGTCKSAYAKLNGQQVLQQHLCAGSSKVGVCKGDSGGPLVVQDGTGGWQLAGIASFGDSCEGKPYSVFTRVAMYRDWIHSTTGS